MFTIWQHLYQIDHVAVAFIDTRSLFRELTFLHTSLSLLTAAKPIYPVSGAAAYANKRFAQADSGGW
jgi:hypothetical protein